MHSTHFWVKNDFKFIFRSLFSLFIFNPFSNTSLNLFKSSASIFLLNINLAVSSPTSVESAHSVIFPAIFDALIVLVLPCIPETSISILILVLILILFACVEKYLEL